MGRNATFTEKELIETALAVISKKGVGAVTVSAIRDELGVTTGSIYHRYGSIRQILAEAWLSAVESFQKGVLNLLKNEDTYRGGLDAALFTVRWSREHPLEARTLLCYHRDDLVSGKWPREVRGKAERLGHELKEGMEDYISRRFVNPTEEQSALVRFALIDIPTAAVRTYLRAGTPIPAFMEEYIRRAVEALTK